MDTNCARVLQLFFPPPVLKAGHRFSRPPCDCSALIWPLSLQRSGRSLECECEACEPSASSCKLCFNISRWQSRAANCTGTVTVRANRSVSVPQLCPCVRTRRLRFQSPEQTCSHTSSCLCPPLVPRSLAFFSSVSWIALVCVLFYLFAFPQAPSLSFCWHVQWSVGQTGNAVSSKRHFSGQKKVTSVTKITGQVWLMMPMSKYCLGDHLLSLLLLYYLQHCSSHLVFLLHDSFYLKF